MVNTLGTIYPENARGPGWLTAPRLEEPRRKAQKLPGENPHFKGGPMETRWHNTRQVRAELRLDPLRSLTQKPCAISARWF